MTSPTSTQPTRSEISDLLDDLSPESLKMVEQFMRFLHSQEREYPSDEPKQPGFHYPTVTVPASSLDVWMNLLAEGYDGNALADTEALYDEV